MVSIKEGSAGRRPAAGVQARGEGHQARIYRRDYQRGGRTAILGLSPQDGQAVNFTLSSGSLLRVAGSRETP